jgi:hypothetical protein
MFESAIWAIVGGIAVGVGWAWTVIIAFHESRSQGLLCLFVPPYVIYYGATRRTNRMRPLVIASVGVLLAVVGMVLLPRVGIDRNENVRGWYCIVTGVMSIEVIPVIEQFMEAGAERDIDSAYACWSPKWVTRDYVAGYIESNYDNLFAGYRDLEFEAGDGSGDGGYERFHATGQIAYYIDGEKVLSFEAWVVKENENDTWKITRIQIG